MINQFAAVTRDRQFIHVDPVAARDTPFGGTIAHGFLTLSLLTHMIESVVLLPPNMVSAINFEMGVNAKGTWLCCRYGIQQMLDQEPIHELVRGRIVNFASVAGLKGMPNSSMYSQAKTSVIGLTRALAIEYCQSGITVNAIAPGLVQTGMSRKGFDDPELAAHLIAATPTGRHGIPTDVSRAVLFLATDEAGFLTGHTLPVDGGMVAL